MDKKYGFLVGLSWVVMIALAMLPLHGKASAPSHGVCGSSCGPVSVGKWHPTNGGAQEFKEAGDYHLSGQ